MTSQLTTDEYNELRTKRNALRDSSQHLSHVEYNNTVKHIKLIDVLLSQYEKQ